VLAFDDEAKGQLDKVQNGEEDPYVPMRGKYYSSEQASRAAEALLSKLKGQSSESIPQRTPAQESNPRSDLDNTEDATESKEQAEPTINPQAQSTEQIIQPEQRPVSGTTTVEQSSSSKTQKQPEKPTEKKTAEQSPQTEPEVDKEARNKDLREKINKLVNADLSKVAATEGSSVEGHTKFATPQFKVAVDAFAYAYGANSEKFYDRISEIVDLYSNNFDGSVVGQDAGYKTVAENLTDAEKKGFKLAMQNETTRRDGYAKKSGLSGPGLMPSADLCLRDMVYQLSGKGNPTRIK